jgi:hypothetical protein
MSLDGFIADTSDAVGPLFDWYGTGDAVFVVTHQAPAAWSYPEAPFTFVTDGLPSAIAQAKAFAGNRDVSLPPAISPGRPSQPAGRRTAKA